MESKRRHTLEGEVATQLRYRSGEEVQAFITGHKDFFSHRSSCGREPELKESGPEERLSMLLRVVLLSYYRRVIK